MNKLKRILYLYLFKKVPSTRFYKFKAFLLRNIGFKVSSTARIVSSVKILGINNIVIGHDTFIGHDTIIIGAANSNVRIGSFCDISSKVTIVTGTHNIDINGDRIAGKGNYKDITIEDGVWIGINATILPGVKIGKKSIIAAGAIVVNDIPSYSLAGGNPAKIIRKLK